MKKILFILLFGICCVSCCNDDSTQHISHEQQYFNSLKRSKVIDPEEHELIMYEACLRGTRNYSFSIEHSPNCKKCYELFN